MVNFIYYFQNEYKNSLSFLVSFSKRKPKLQPLFAFKLLQLKQMTLKLIDPFVNGMLMMLYLLVVKLYRI